MKHKIGNMEIPVTWLARFYRQNVLELTQTQVADMSGKKQPHICMFESGQWMPSIYEAYRDMGLGVFLDRLTTREKDVIRELYSHEWAKKLNRAEPGKILIRTEWLED